MNPEQFVEKVRVFLVWDTDTSGAYLFGIYATREGAYEAHRTMPNSSWIDDGWWIEGARNDGYPPPQPFTDEQVAAHIENARIDGDR